MRYSAPNRRLILALSALLLFVAAASQLAGQAKQKSRSASKSDPKPVLKEVPPPFHVGEQLDYRVGWSSFAMAATVRLAVAERRNLYGWDTWHLRAVTHTLSPLRMLFAIDDQFDSYTDTQTLESHQFEMYLHEQGKQENDIVHLTYPGIPSRSDGPNVIVLPGTRDPVGALYALREVDWRRVREASAPVFDGRKLYQMQARLGAASEQVTVPAGTFSAARVDVRVLEQGKEVPEANFAVWFAQDPPRTPVLVQADLPFGSLRVELTSATQ
jgi:hypothetical protein